MKINQGIMDKNFSIPIIVLEDTKKQNQKILQR